ncbi:TCR/Tet family MFS transporter [Cytophaga aurantiaca]|uniref:TCR/Tet family MFS transporter n=1 Tax=Cytophaga aurantiaca TaxID=29530 RepID=UPI00036D9EC0|nr:tetracycline resistance MFS efflux pump [Cytophaga aurantiaca]
MNTNKNASLGFVFITLLIDVIGIGIIIPVTPDLIKDLTGEGLSEAAQYSGWLMFAYAIMQFFFSPILGALSDKYGRRPILLLSLLGLGFDYIFSAFAPTIGWLFVGRLLAGISGASFTTATAYIADISTPENRTQNFGLVGVAFGLGFIIGPVIGGVTGDWWGPRAPFMVAAAFTLLNVLYGYFFVPESLPKENRRTFEWKRANPIGSLLHLKKYPIVAGLVAAMFLFFIAGHAVQSNWTFFTEYKFEWDKKEVGYSLGFVGLIVAIVQGGLIRIIIPKIGQKWAVYIGLVLNAFGLLLFAFATEGWMMIAILIPYALGGIAGPALQGITSAQVPATEQGELQGALTSLMSVTSIIGPPLMNNLFSYFTGEGAPIELPGAPFLLGALMIAASVYLSVRTLRKYEG